MSSLFGKSKRKRPFSSCNPTPSDSASTRKVDSDAENKNESQKIVEKSSILTTFADLGLAPPLVTTCKNLGLKRPTPVQRVIIPQILQHRAHILALAATGSGKTAAFCLPIIHKLARDPYGIFAVVLTPTRELAKQIQEQVLALGSSYKITSTLAIGGMDPVRQSCALDQRPHFCVATPGRLAELLRGPQPPKLRQVRYLVLDEADRLLSANSGFERDMAELLLHITVPSQNATSGGGEGTGRQTYCQTLLFSVTLTKSLESIEEMAGAGKGRLPLKKFVIHDDKTEPAKTKKQKAASGRSNIDEDEGTSNSEDQEDLLSVPSIPAGLKQEYIFMPSRVRVAYLITTIRNLLVNGGRRGGGKQQGRNGSGWTLGDKYLSDDEDGTDGEAGKAHSAIVFVSTCERAAKVSGILSELGVDNVALHSLLSQNRRLAALGKFKSQQVRILVATDVASRGLDIPTVDLVLNSELPRRAVDYVHRVGRTARAGRRGRSISLVGESDVALVHAAEKMSGRQLEKCEDITDDMAIKLLGPVTKAARLAKMKLMDIGFDELVQKMKERKARDRKERERAQRAMQKIRTMDKSG